MPTPKSLRESNLRRLDGGHFDVFIAGAGINGAVSASCLAAKGAKVALVDRGDFAGETSQHSSNLAWGGLKYLENGEVGLVLELCASRNHLIRSYPSTVQEIRFLAVHERGFRHGLWKLYLGTFIYWVFGRFFTKRPRLLDVASLAREEPKVDVARSDGGFEYSDAFFHDNDARFVWNFVRTTLDDNGVAANYVACVGARREGDRWTIDLEDVVTGRRFQATSRVFVNACGPWVDALNGTVAQETRHTHVLSKGIHLIVPRISKETRVLTFFADDGRPFFAIPMGRCTSIGTTDTRVTSPSTEVTDEDRAFVLDNINKRLRLDKPLSNDDIIAERCGVRPLSIPKKNDDGSAVDWFDLSRKHVIEVDEATRHVSIFGGKLTDCLNVGEEVSGACEKLGVTFTFPEIQWYGEPDVKQREEFFHRARLMKLDDLTPPQEEEPLSARLWRRYGAHAFGMLDAMREDPTMGEVLIDGASYLRCEVLHTARREMVVTLADFLRRRSKIALVVRHDAIARAPGLEDAARILFGDEADAKMQAYFGTSSAPRVEPVVPTREAPAVVMAPKEAAREMV